MSTINSLATIFQDLYNLHSVLTAGNVGSDHHHGHQDTGLHQVFLSCPWRLQRHSLTFIQRHSFIHSATFIQRLQRHPPSPPPYMQENYKISF